MTLAVNLFSAMQASATLDLDDLQFERRPFQMTQSYGQSKLALLMLTKELARRLQGTGVTVNAAHPGWVAISPEEGAKTSVYLALSPEVTGFIGVLPSLGSTSLAGHRDRKIEPPIG